MSIAYFIPPTLPPDEPARVRALHDSGLVELSATLGLDSILARAIRATQTRSAAITAVIEDQALVLAAVGFSVGIMRRSSSFSGHAILYDEPVFVVPDAEADERFAGNPIVADDMLLRFFAAVPLRTPRGHPLGTLSVFDPAPREGLRDEEAAELGALGAEVMARLIERQFPPAVSAAQR